VAAGLRTPLYLTLLFAVVTGLWFLGGDGVIERLFPDAFPTAWREIWKDSLHLLFSTIFVYLLLRHERLLSRQHLLALQESQDHYRQFYEQAPTAYQSLDQDGAIREVNEKWEQLTGYSRSEVIGHPMRELVAPEARRCFDEEFARFVKGEEIHAGEITLLRKDGSPLVVAVESRICRTPHANQCSDFCANTYCALFDITTQRHTEMTLKANEARLAYALDNANDGVWDWQITTDEIYFSPRWQTMLGFAPGELPQHKHSWSERIHPDDRPLVEAALEAHFRGRTPEYALDHRMRTKDGKWKWILTRGRVVERDTDGRPLRMIGTHVDIDRRKSLEQRLAASEQRYRLTAEAGRVAAWELWLETGWLQADDTLYDLLGYQRDEVAPNWEEWIKLALPESRRLIKREIIRLQRGGHEHLTMELQVRHKTGRVVWLHCNGRLTQEGNGEVKRVLGICIDITQSKLAEQALREEHRRAERYLEVAEVILVGLDRNGRIELLNRKGYEVLGYDPGSLDGLNWFDTTIPEDSTMQVKKVFDELMRGEVEPHAYVENEVLTRDGGRRLIAWRNALIIDDDGKINGSFSSGTDITDLRQADKERERLRRELAQAQKMEAVGRLTGGIAHDFNNILASVLGYTGLALERFGDQSPPKMVDYLQEVKIAGERARDLIAQLLRFSREGGGTPRHLNLAPLVKEVVKMLEAPMTTGIRIDTDLDPDTPPVLIDPVQAHQVLVNLCINARDAMDGRGLIRVRLRRLDSVQGECAGCHRALEGSWVELAVIDQGKGIEPEELGRIFDPFYTTKEPDQGSGIGLAVTRGILEQHGGHILVDSTPGAGSSFRMLFPIPEQPETDEAVIDPASSWAEGTAPERLSGELLVVDDEHSLIGYLKDLLQEHGCHVTAVDSAREALQQFKQAPEHFDLVISDQIMPDMTGAELAEKLLALRPGLPVIIYSGYSETLDEQQAREIGISRFLRKPVEPEILLRVVAELLSEQ